MSADSDLQRVHMSIIEHLPMDDADTWDKKFTAAMDRRKKKVDVELLSVAFRNAQQQIESKFYASLRAGTNTDSLLMKQWKRAKLVAPEIKIDFVEADYFQVKKIEYKQLADAMLKQVEGDKWQFLRQLFGK